MDKGDTLYSIAWRYGRDYKELAAANEISPPYVIKVGQKIRLDLTASLVKKIAASEKKIKPIKHKKRQKKVTKYKIKYQKTNKKLNDRPKSFPKLSHPKYAVKKRRVGGVVWRWPHVGKVIASYSVTLTKKAKSRSRHKSVNKGIDIKGKIGDSIFASASGEVVYAGSGLRGYGKLIILNHNEHYLSAYAHNNKIRVVEGQKVRSGDVIAEMGKTGSPRTLLHFEIRKDGNPVDPVKYLPKSK